VVSLGRVQCEGGVMQVARGVGRVRFRLEFEEFLEVEHRGQ